MSAASNRNINNRQRLIPHCAKPYSIRFTDEEINSVEEQLCAKFRWKAARPFQLDGIRAQLRGQDAIIHVATSMGKTAVAAGPFVLDQCSQLIIIYIIPLLALQDEMAVTFPAEFGISAVAINSQVTTSNKDLIRDVISGKYRVILISPESLLSPRFIKDVLSTQEFTQSLLSVVIDEAHVISLLGADFRKLYGSLSILRAFLPQGIPFIALSATLTPRVYRDLIKRLEFRSDHKFINEGNDRGNVTLISRKCVHPLETYRDLGFVVPPHVKERSDILKTFIYADSIEDGTGIVDYLTNECLPTALQSSGLIRPYNASFSTPYRQLVMELFRRGLVRVLVCTDAAGMGCNISDIGQVVQWKSPNSIESFQQRAGRVERSKSRTGIAVLLAEPNAYKVDPTEPASANVSAPNMQLKSRRRSGRPARGTKKKMSDIASGEIEIREDSPGGGIYAFIQTTSCRRAILTRVFNNPTPDAKVLSSGVPCCDVCDPSVLDKVRVPPPKTRRRVVQAKKGQLNPKIVKSLIAWREVIHKRDHSHVQWAPNALLDDQTIHSIANRPDIALGTNLARLLEGSWGYWGHYGGELLDLLKQAPVPRPAVNDPTRDSQVDDKAPQRPNSGGTTYSELIIGPASPRSQWQVLTTPMLPAHMTPVVPSQKRANLQDLSQSQV
ncbi:Atp-dependent dna helicase, partial [Rhizoctonia solani]